MLFVIFMWLGVIFVVQSFWRKIALLYEGQSVSLTTLVSSSCYVCLYTIVPRVML